MMKRLSGLIAAFLVLAVCVGVGDAQVTSAGHYFGQEPPGFSPVVFAPDIVSLPGRFEWCLTFSPSMDECVFGTTNAVWDGFNLWYTKMGSDSTWIDPIPAPFQGSGDAFFPFYSGDGSDIYFVSSRPSYPPTRIWRSSRAELGWTEPVALEAPIYSGANEWGSSFADDGTLYFSSNRAGGFGGGDLYRAVAMPDGEVTVENLGAVINSAQDDGSACIARDGSYLIFESNRPGGLGQADLYISYNENGVWTTPRNLGSAINTSWIEDGPFISPDGKYMFFNRRRAWYTSTQTEIWWVDARAVFHPEQSGANDPGPSTRDGALLRSEPNPFGLATTITYSTPSPGFVAIKIYDVVGREVRSLVNRPVAAGIHSVEFEVPPSERPTGGVYYCSLHVGGKKLRSTKLVSLR